MAINNLCFSDYDPVTGPPNPNDGFTGVDDAGVITNESEPGYVLGDRLDLGGGGVGTGSGFPPAIFQCVKNADYLNLAFFCRFDQSFDDQDAIVLAVKPKTASPQTDARRIDIFPVHTGIGADDPVACGTATMPKVCPDDSPQPAPPPPQPGDPPPPNYHIRTHPARIVKHYRGTGGAVPWTTVNPTSPPSSYQGPTNLTIVARSWQPVPTECAWSVEVQLPRTIALGGGDWIDLPDSFAIYFCIMRVGSGTVAPFNFPVGLGNALTGVLGAGTSIPAYGTGYIPSLQSPPGGNCGQGVKFISGEGSVGVRSTTAGPWSALGTTIVGPAGTTDNRLVAQVQNTSTDPADDAPGVTAEFRFANWGLGSPDFPSWAPAKEASPMPTTPTTIPHGGSAELTSDWPHASVPASYSNNPHQCVWVQLDSAQPPPGVPINFIQSSVRRNMDFVQLSRHDEPAEISGVGYPAPAQGSHHDFLLYTNVRKIVLRGGREEDVRHRALLAPPLSQEGPPPKVVWLWIVHGYRRTGQTIEIEGTTFEILDDAPGAFGYLATHDTIEDVFTHRLSGGGIRDEGGGFYSLRVPVNGSVTIQTHIGAEPPGPRGWLRWLLGLLRRLLRLLVRWIRKLFGG